MSASLKYNYMNSDLIQVLWVEDDPLVTQSYPIEAARFGIELVPYACWEEAEKALNSNFKRWSAIVLDAKCKYKRDSHDNAATFLAQAMYSITTICTNYQWDIPWFVLSGGSEDELNDLIIDSRKAWDGDWDSKKYYSKTTDREILFQRIQYLSKKSHELNIKTRYYKDVFDAIENAGLNTNVEKYMVELLLPIHSHKYSDNKEYNHKMTLIRKCIEFIFLSMAQHGILPNEERDNKTVLHHILVDRRGGINTTWCSKILSGKETGDDKSITIKSNTVLPNVLKDSFQRLIYISVAYEHADNKHASNEQQANSRQTTQFLDCINNAPYLLRGMAMELCTIILWYSYYLNTHHDKEQNASNWEVVGEKDE